MKIFHLLGFAPYYTNSFLLITEGGSAVVIDPSADPKKYNRLLGEHNAKLTHIFLTHGHLDHVSAAEELRKQWNATLYLDSADARGSTMLPMTISDACYTEGGEITVDELTFKTWHTPGHTPGCWCILCGEHFFTGDTLFQMSIGRTDFAESNHGDMVRSLKKLCELDLPDSTIVLPGHMDFSTLGQEKRLNPYLRG